MVEETSRRFVMLHSSLPSRANFVKHLVIGRCGLWSAAQRRNCVTSTEIGRGEE
jgi:hypothetical protein